MIGKTRDRSNKLEQVFIEVSPAKGFPYRGIATRGTKRVTSGINDKGLVLVSAAASGMEKEGKVSAVGTILSKTSSVDEVMTMVQKGEIQGPIYHLIGDIHKIVLLEVIHRHRYDSLVKENGILCHTKHLILKDVRGFYRKIGASSQARMNRIERLLEDVPFSRERFMAMTRDHFNGPGDNSICRHFEAETRSGEQTVSAAVYYLPRQGPQETWVSLGQPCQSAFISQPSAASP